MNRISGRTIIKIILYFMPIAAILTIAFWIYVLGLIKG